MTKMRYRLALSMGCASLGWSLLRIGSDGQPMAIIKAGVRTYSDGRNPKDASSLAVTRREARALRRRRDRMLKRKARMMAALIAHGFFPADAEERKSLVRLNPYALRAKGLDQALSGPEFARALFHLNQRRGFKSNRKTDCQGNDSGTLKTAIQKLRTQMQAYQLVRAQGTHRLRHPSLSASGKPLVMRLVIGDTLRLVQDGKTRTMRLAKMSGNGQVFMAPTSDARVDARNRDPEDPFVYTSKMAGSLFATKARRVTISPLGDLRDPGFSP